MPRDQAYLNAACEVLRRRQRVQPPGLHKAERAHAGDDVQAGRAMTGVRKRLDNGRRWEQPVAGNEDRSVGRPDVFARQHGTEQPELTRRTESEHAAHIPRIAPDAEREKAGAAARERAEVLAALYTDVPRHTLKVGQKRVADSDCPMTTDWIALTVQLQHVRPTEKVVMD